MAATPPTLTFLYENISIRSFLGIGLLGVDMADDAVRVVELRRRAGKTVMPALRQRRAGGRSDA